MKNEQKIDKDRKKEAPPSAGGTTDGSSSRHMVFDWDGLLYRLMGDEELSKEIIEDFLHHFPVNLEALKQSLDKNDGLQVKREAHVIKGSAGNVGAVVLQEIAEKIETAGRSGDMVEAQLLFTELNTQLDVLKNELNLLFR
jgi:HPt (histidine-containing phosphotransfer) domain-containing protein